MKKIGLGLLGFLILFFVYVSTRDGHISVERSELIQASPEEIFPHISNLKLGGEWSPFEKADPEMKKTFVGVENQVGAVLEFDSDKGAGAGRLEILKIIPNEAVDLRLIMTKPMSAENLIEYRLTPESQGTRFTWRMSGDGGFLGKLMPLFIDCDKMIGRQFEEGIANLKSVVETKNAEG